ncbi:hypothetical protein PM085_18860 [Halorubrum ezzemoulense]|uniref:CBS domain-containing protein n=1 Tax=Halorubrum ezzemoulense TaxID=337243 RepID=A0ABT4Z7V9_HALEZ|nr:hypothetical protein [Halorubrum ezzemoulense]MDB2294275.1 hypothetical protein [Halorubrum ezzemoulense]
MSSLDLWVPESSVPGVAVEREVQLNSPPPRSSLEPAPDPSVSADRERRSEPDSLVPDALVRRFIRCADRTKSVEIGALPVPVLGRDVVIVLAGDGEFVAVVRDHKGVLGFVRRRVLGEFDEDLGIGAIERVLKQFVENPARILSFEALFGL